MNIKILLAIIYAAVVVLLGAATIAGQCHGIDYVREACYGAPWMIALWIFLVLSGLVHIVRSHVRRFSFILLHASFVVILLGAFLTHLFGVQGTLHLRKGSFSTIYVPSQASAGSQQHTLPFAVRLDDFSVQLYVENGNIADYKSMLTIADTSTHQMISRHEVSMNNIAVCRNWRFYQWSYDSDGMGSTLIVNHDPWGIAVTYIGYFMLFAALCMETIHCCRRIVRHKRKEGRFTRFERAVLAVAISLSVAIMLCGAWFFITQMTDTNPWISQMQPILNSPLLSVHVAIIAVAYLLLLMAFVISIHGIITRRYRQLSLLLLYPAVACLAAGIFVGAIWANLSWGEYWSWDPKESWALVSMMVYAVPLHHRSIPWMRSDRAYHLYIALSFLVLLFTCFGVNTLLSGLHSYA